ncbi:MAG: rhodanese-like domain-containing protein [Deltaproteobacteria bacterium]|nr:rhodanese-like domain-containing protein [Deltaproteobacteria bacterium]
MKFKLVAILIAVLAAAGLLGFKQPTLEKKLARLEPELNERIQKREIQIDAAELLSLINNNNVGLSILDVRDETDFNLFHIADSKLVTMAQVRNSGWVGKLPARTILVLVSNDEQRAAEAWKLLTAQKVINLYILEGGINRWLEIYGHMAASSEPAAEDTLRYSFSAALGAKNPASDPDPAHVPERKYTKKVKSIGGAARKSGGCG